MNKRKLRRAHMIDWCIVALPDIFDVYDDPESAFAAPESDVPIALFGRAMNDTRYDPETDEFADGHRIITSQIQKISMDEGMIYTTNTAYTLGEMNDGYREWCDPRPDEPAFQWEFENNIQEDKQND